MKFTFTKKTRQETAPLTDTVAKNNIVLKLDELPMMECKLISGAPQVENDPEIR